MRIVRMAGEALMQCNCGSSRSKPMDSRKTIDRVVYSLNVLVCDICGRVGSESLYRNKLFVASGMKARQEFNQIEDPVAHSHMPEHEAPANTEDVT